jgi:hypothetical protein
LTVGAGGDPDEVGRLLGVESSGHLLASNRDGGRRRPAARAALRALRPPGRRPPDRRTAACGLRVDDDAPAAGTALGAGGAAAALAHALVVARRTATGAAAAGAGLAGLAVALGLLLGLLLGLRLARPHDAAPSGVPAPNGRGESPGRTGRRRRCRSPCRRRA